jgi:hypothetical protein
VTGSGVDNFKLLSQYCTEVHEKNHEGFSKSSCSLA